MTGPVRDAAGARSAGAALVAALAMGLAGCSLEPSAPLVRLPERPATVLPSEVPATRADGFPNILADPATVAGLPREPAAVERGVATLAAEGRTARTRTAGIARGGAADALRRRGRTHVEEARRAIAASGRASAAPAIAPADPEAVRGRIASSGTRPTRDDAASVTAEPRPIEPQAPRAVGPPGDDPVAPSR